MVNKREPDISAAQVRAARAWLGWNQDLLAEKAGVSKTALIRFERGKGKSVPHPETWDRLRRTLEEAGVRFLFRKMTAVGIEVVAVAEPDSP